jgi:fluoride exporter
VTGWGWVLVALGGGLGAAARYLSDTAVSQRNGTRVFPFGTLLVNVSGAALLGALTATVNKHGLISAGIGVGFCGGFTTFSTFTWETLALAEDGMPRLAVGYVAASLVLGLTAAGLTYGVV